LKRQGLLTRENYHTTRLSSDTELIYSLCLTNSQSIKYVSTEQVKHFSPRNCCTYTHISGKCWSRDQV